MNEDKKSKTKDPKQQQHIVLALYKFVTIPQEEIPSLQSEVEAILRSVNAKGSILLAAEGVNGTICYPAKEAGDLVQDYLQNHRYFMGLRTRTSHVDAAVFHRLKVKIKKEIVTIGGDINETDEAKKPIGFMSKCTIDPTKIVGTYVPPGKEWDDLCDDPDVVVIDTRNKYEIDIGTFENAINPNTDNFRQFPDWLHRFATACKNVDGGSDGNAQHQEEKIQCVSNSKCESESADNARNPNPVPDEKMPVVRKTPKAIAMFCTGGIRCEKSTSYTIAANVFPKDIPVYHLDGGVLAYLDAHPDEKKSKWKGECFVFDQRVAVTHGLKPSSKLSTCHACRRPISIDDMERLDYVKGVCCRYCKDAVTEKQMHRFEERQKQIELAESKGSQHIHDSKDVKELIE